MLAMVTAPMNWSKRAHYEGPALREIVPAQNVFIYKMCHVSRHKTAI